MVESIENRYFFHVTAPASAHRPGKMSMGVGTRFDCGEDLNPFFQEFANSRYVKFVHEGTDVTLSMLDYLQNATNTANGIANSPEFPQTAYDIANRYMMLSRELILEEKRLEIAPTAPSRRKCLWVCEELWQARYWISKLGTPNVIAKLRLNGTIHRGDSSFVGGSGESLLDAYGAATQYWQGEMTDDPKPEVLFAGTAEVTEIFESLGKAS